MPPEVAMRRKELGRRRGLIAATVAVLTLTIAGIVGSYWYAGAAEARLAEERRTTEQLLATQLEYAEVVQVRNQLAAVTDVRAALGSAEVLWGPALEAYLAVFSPDEIVKGLSFQGAAPADPPLGTAGPLREPRVATVTIVISTTEQPEPWRWYRAWEGIESYGDASIDSIVLLEDAYETTLTLNLTESALSQRFPAEEESP
jgi:hypothetical protein